MNVFLTLDYELFLGKQTGSIDNCLIRPMTALLNVLDNYNIKTTIFVDAAYLLRMKELMPNNFALKEDFEIVTSHISELNIKGHDIQLHFHPQWLFSKYNEGWELDFSHYKLSDVPESFLLEKFKTACLLLESITGRSIVAFRAGGYSLETYKDYIKLFKENNIKIDSSVIRDAFALTEFQVYDYRSIPGRTKFNFSNSIKREDVEGDFTELVISSNLISGISYFLKKEKLLFNYKPQIVYGDGMGIGLNGSVVKRLVGKISKLFHPHVIGASMDGVLSAELYSIFKKYANETDFVIIGHPKGFSDISIKNLNEFIEKVNCSVVFKTVSEVNK